MASVLLFDEVSGKRVLDFADIALVEPGPGEVRYRVEAFALNRADLLYLYGAHYSVAHLPSRIGLEGCGIVDAIGSGVSKFAIGDRVTSIPFNNVSATDCNVAGEYAITPEPFLMAAPARLTSEEACSITMQYLTAYYPIVEIAKMGPGQSILVTGASSSAGLAAIQIAKSLGVTVIAQTRTGEKSAAILAAGADFVIASEKEPLAEKMLEYTGGRGVDVSYDPLSDDFIGTYMDALAYGSRVFMYGTQCGPTVTFDLVQAVRRHAIIHPYSLYNHVNDPASLERGIAWLADAINSGKFTPVIDTVFPWKRALESYEYMQENKHVGKIVVSLTQ